jgi:hypothetical protein
MTPAAVFSIANTLALVTWIALALFQHRRWATHHAVRTVVALFAVAYVAIIATTWAGSSGGFSSLDAVATLFADPWLLLAGWLHYLAFDLLIGRWEVRDAASCGISPWFVAPCLALTFMFGPAGWLTYMAVRMVHQRSGHSWSRGRVQMT